MNIDALPRTYLYVPGNATDKLSRALGRGADALIIDLEDAVPVAEKDSTLAAVCEWLRSQPAAGATELWVRLNAGPRRQSEVRALAGIPSLRGMVLAKSEDPSELQVIDELLTSLRDEKSVLMPLLESAAALLNALSIARGPRVRQLQIGEVDLAGETGIEPGSDEAELAPMRTMVVLASTAAGLCPPVGPVSQIVKDVEAFVASTRRTRRQGFLGRACIHPTQIDLVHDVFRPNAAEVADARNVIELLAAAETVGSGVVLDSAGRMLDAAVLRNAHKTLALAAREES